MTEHTNVSATSLATGLYAGPSDPRLRGSMDQEYARLFQLPPTKKKKKKKPKTGRPETDFLNARKQSGGIFKGAWLAARDT